jgi:formamidopyrimidine-DNA glycosylase
LPELPETETIAADLNRILPGRRIETVVVLRSDVLRGIGPRAFCSRSVGSTMLRVWRRAKTVIIDLAGPRHVLATPRFTGALLFFRDAPPPDPFTVIEWGLSDGAVLRYRDVRRLGTIHLVDRKGLEAFDARLGPEPLGPDFTIERLSGILRSSRRAIKLTLMDSSRIAGIGNIYANEALWGAGIDPSLPSALVADDAIAKLHSAIVDVLQRAVESRGTTFRDYRDPSNSAGGFGSQLQVYGRAGGPCGRCGTRLAESHAIDGRSTVFCFRCQR